MFSSNLAACQLATWAEDVIKFKLKVSKKWKRKPKKKKESNKMGMEWEAKCGRFYSFFHDFTVFLQIFSKLHLMLVICFFFFFVTI